MKPSDHRETMRHYKALKKALEYPHLSGTTDEDIGLPGLADLHFNGGKPFLLPASRVPCSCQDPTHNHQYAPKKTLRREDADLPEGDEPLPPEECEHSDGHVIVSVSKGRRRRQVFVDAFYEPLRILTLEDEESLFTIRLPDITLRKATAWMSAALINDIIAGIELPDELVPDLKYVDLFGRDDQAPRPPAEPAPAKKPLPPWLAAIAVFDGKDA